MIYVDELYNWGQKGHWCHMATDGNLDELHAMALRIGLKRKWFQDHARVPHYDLTPNKRTQALRNGAQAVSSQELVLLCRISSES